MHASHTLLHDITTGDVLCQEWTNERERIAFFPHAGDRRRATVTVSALPPSFSLCSYDTHQCPVRKLPSFLLLAATSTTRVVTQKNKRPKSERASELSWRRRRRRLSSPFLALSFRSRRHRSRNSAAATARFAVRPLLELELESDVVPSAT